MPKFVAAIDQGTTSTRCIIFDHSGRVVGSDQREHHQIFPKAGWVEHDGAEIRTNTDAVIAGALDKTGLTSADIAAVGITNQRETTLIWDRGTGEPVYNAIVWQDTRTDRICEKISDGDLIRSKTGLPISTYFSGPKARWIYEEIKPTGDLCFGTMDSWVLWNLTDGAVHATDVTNASRTLLMDLETLQWDAELCDLVGVDPSTLPEIRSSSGDFGTVAAGPLKGVPITGILGDQQAATFGQACLEPGQAKNTYGTGNFMLLNTGTTPVASNNGLLTTVCYQIGDQAAVYALEGSIAVTGSLVQWLRDNLGIISTAADIEPLALSVEDNGGGLFRSRFLGAVRTALAPRRPRRFRRPDTIRQQGPPRPRGTRGDGVPDP